MIKKVIKHKELDISNQGFRRFRTMITYFLFGIIPIWYIYIVYPDGRSN